MNVINAPTIYTSEQQAGLLSKNEISIDSIEFKEEASLDILGYKVDLQYFIISVINMIIANFLLYQFGMFDLMKKYPAIFYLYLAMIIFFLYKLFTASVLSANIQLEITNLLIINQLISVFIGSVILLIVFMYYISTTSPKFKFNVKHYIYVLCILFAISLNLSVQQVNANQLRGIRRFKELTLDTVKFLMAFLLITDLM
jgi:hypothetical protein